MKHALHSRNWFGKASAGVVLGFTLALGLSGLLMHALGVSDTFFSTRGQLTMWSISPLWAGIVSFVFLFSSGLRAWLWLAAANILIWVPLLLWTWA